MNRLAFTRKPDQTAALWLVAHMVVGWALAPDNGKTGLMLWLGSFLLSVGVLLFFLSPRWWLKTVNVHRYAVLSILVCFTWFWASTYHSLTVVLLHIVSVLVLSAIYLRAVLILGTSFAYGVGWLLTQPVVSASWLPHESKLVLFFCVAMILHVLLTLCQVYREHLVLTRKLEREQNFERLGNQQHLATIGQIAASIAHDIRNPLTSIQGFIQLIEKQERRESHLQYYKIIRSEISRIDSLIREVLVLSKSHAVDMEKWSDVNLSELLQRLVKLMDPDAIKCNVEIVLHLEATPVIVGSDEKLQQVFMNLIRNALEAIESGGRIDIFLLQGKDEAAIVVRDTGPGIPENMLEHLFTPFYTSKPEGTGLGLSICQSIVRSSGGSIQVRNLPEGGAEFTVTLPLDAASQASPAYRQNDSVRH